MDDRRKVVVSQGLFQAFLKVESLTFEELKDSWNNEEF